MERLIADKIKRNNEKIKAQANKNKTKSKGKENGLVQVNEPPKPVMKESKTLMLDI